MCFLHYNTAFPNTNSAVPNLVEIRDLHFSYGDRSILSNLRMDFPRGKVVAVMGGSGCGKTTVLRLIGGQIRPQKGEVKVPLIKTTDGAELAYQEAERLTTGSAHDWLRRSEAARAAVVRSSIELRALAIRLPVRT